MSESSLYRRVIRRQRHRSRSLAVIITLSVLAVVAAYVGVESVLAAVHAAPLLVAPDAAVKAVLSADLYATLGAVVAVLLGIVLLVIAVAPARLRRHSIPDDRLAIVVDDRALAGALAGAARSAAGLRADRVSADVTARRGHVVLTPTSGVPVDRAAVGDAVAGIIRSLNPTPAVRTSVTLTAKGVVGS